MVSVVNNNLKMVDLPIWEQLQSAPTATAAGSCICDDEDRFIYYLQASANFWRYDTWTNTWQQLANATGTVGTGSVMQYSMQVGGYFNGVLYGSIFAIISNGVAAPVLTRYDIATNTWVVLSVTGLPATFGTDSSIVYPTAFENANAGGFTGAVSVVTSGAILGATTVPVTAITKAMGVGTVLNFGTQISPKYAVLTASATASATSLTVAPLVVALLNTDTAYYADNIYLIGNATAQLYRYSVGANTWLTTADIVATPTIGVAPAVTGAGLGLKWLNGLDPDYLYLFRGAATANIYRYQLSTNTWSTLTFHPVTETFTTGTIHATRKDSNGKNKSFLIQKDATLRIYEFMPSTLKIDPKITQFLLATSTAIVGDKLCCLKSPEGIEFLYFLLHTSTSFVRSPLFF